MSSDRLASALACRLAGLFGPDAAGPASVNVFDRDAEPLGQRRLDSLDLVEVSVMMEAELGLRLHQDDLVEAGSINGLADLAQSRANPGAVSAFLAEWEPRHSA